MHVEQWKLDTEQVKDRLMVYGNNAVMVSGLTDYVGEFEISPEKISSCFDPNQIIIDAEKGIGHLKITDENCEGHFDTEKGLPLIFPGYCQVGAAAHTLGRLSGYRANLSSIGSVAFLGMVRPGDELRIIPEVTREQTNVKLKHGDEVVTFIEDLQYEELIGGTVPNSVLIQSAAQTLGLTFLLATNSDVSTHIPLFQKIGNAIWHRAATLGEKIKVVIDALDKLRNGFKGTATISQNDEIIAQIEDIQCRVVPMELAKKLLRGRM